MGGDGNILMTRTKGGRGMKRKWADAYPQLRDTMPPEEAYISTILGVWMTKIRGRCISEQRMSLT